MRTFIVARQTGSAVPALSPAAARRMHLTAARKMREDVAQTEFSCIDASVPNLRRTPSHDLVGVEVLTAHQIVYCVEWAISPPSLIY
jgi:hypothetical protein